MNANVDITGVVLETKDLIIKKGVQSDWRDMYYNLWMHEESARYMLWDITTSEEEAKARMERTIVFEKNHEYTWLIYEKKSGQAIGFTGLGVVEPYIVHEEGIAIGPKFINKGYGTQVLQALMEFAKTKLNAKKFLACNRIDNEASRKLQMRCGFIFSHYEERLDERDGKTYVMEHHYYNLDN